MNTFEQYLSEESSKPQWKVVPTVHPAASSANRHELFTGSSIVQHQLEYTIGDNKIVISRAKDPTTNNTRKDMPEYDVFERPGHPSATMTYKNASGIQGYDYFMLHLRQWTGKYFHNVHIYSWPTKAQYEQLSNNDHLTMP